MSELESAEKSALEAEKSRLRWRSRRGLLELDLVFEPFLQHDFDLLSTDELAVYEDLLMVPDNDLLDWVDGHVEAPEPRFREMVKRLRHWKMLDKNLVLQEK